MKFKYLFAFLLMFVAMATGMQATDYGFSIAGYFITSDNYQSQSAGKAWSYDPAANVLHLKDGTISSDVTNVIVLRGDVNPTLKVSVDGLCKLSGKFDTGIYITGNGNHTFSGSGTLDIQSSVVSSNGIVSYSSSNVTFKDLTVNIKQYGGVGFNVSHFASITFDHCDFNINTSDGMAMYGVANSCIPQLILCSADRGWKSDSNGSGFRGITGEGLFASKLKISRDIKYVGVNVAEPVSGQKPATTATTISSGYKVTSLEWKKKLYGNFYSMEENEVFEMGQTYQVIFNIEAQGDSLFNYHDTSIAAMVPTTNGNSPSFFTVNTLKNAYMEYTFPELVGTQYDLWVGGTQVNDINKDDVLGNGYVSYNPSTKTLTLKGGTIQANNTDSSANYRLGCGIYSEVDSLIIDVQGNTTVQGDYEKSYDGIYLKKNTTITGTAQLTGKGNFGIIAGYRDGSTNLTIGGDVTVVAEGTGSCGLIGEYRYFKGQYTYYASLAIKDNATVMAKGSTNTTSLGLWQDFTLDSNHGITAPSGAVWNATQHCICYADGTLVKGEWVVIERTSLRGDVNLDKSVDIADAVCVLNAMAGQSVAGDANVNGDYDENGNPVIDIADLVTVLNIMAGQ